MSLFLDNKNIFKFKNMVCKNVHLKIERLFKINFFLNYFEHSFGSNDAFSYALVINIQSSLARASFIFF